MNRTNANAATLAGSGSIRRGQTMRDISSRPQLRKSDVALAAARQALSAVVALLDAIDTESPGDPGEWVDPVVGSALPKRLIFDACRSGAIAGAVKIGRKWRVRRRDLDAWFESQRCSDPKPANDGASRVIARWRARHAVGGAR